MKTLGVRAGLFCFLFQAEDGIRGAQDCRGLGDVYKRQVLALLLGTPALTGFGVIGAAVTVSLKRGGLPVSYTHLTLPTINTV